MDTYSSSGILSFSKGTAAFWLLECDDTLGLPTGTCFRVNPMNTMCGCTRNTTCIEDPNSENVYIPCFGGDFTDYGSPFYCPSANIVMDTCSCSVNPLTNS
ncbi:hypothetical protein Anas_12673 [Armadillidium nasatum]|uniref:Uncharacterized protein n=1 Tax=Armadillidium nasatum TaxID=96803 RepID=A0A5N5T789_9CRUS|nr:hypothetical protein Anas_12673 [Armadillidium nasatum]